MQCSTPELTSRSGANYRTNRANMEGHLGEILRSRPTLLRRQRRSPDALAFDGLVEARQGRLVRGYFLVRGRQEDDLGQRDRLQAHVDHRDFLLDIHAQAVLPARYRQVDVGQQFRVEQRAVQLAMRIGHAVAVAQGIQRIALARMQLLGLHQRVDDAADMVAEARQLQARELMVQKTQIEGRVMNNDFGAGDVAAQVFDDLVELRLIAEKLGGQAVDIERALFRIALGIDVDMEVIPRQHAVVQFDATDFDDTVAQLGIEAGGFSI